MRRVKPDHRQERLFGFDGAAQERNHAIHDYARVVAFQVLRGELAGPFPILGGERLILAWDSTWARPARWRS